MQRSGRVRSRASTVKKLAKPPLNTAKQLAMQATGAAVDGARRCNVEPCPAKLKPLRKEPSMLVLNGSRRSIA